MLNLNKIRNRQAETAKSSGNWWKPDEGKNLVRIFKFSHKVTPDDVVRRYFKKDEQGKTLEELDRPVTIHYNVDGQDRPVISCKSVMMKYAELKDSSSEEDQEKAKDMRPSRKYYVNILDLDDVDSGMQIWGMPKSVYNKILTILMEPEYGGEDELFGPQGTDFMVTYTAKASPGEMYSVLPRPKGSEKLDKGLAAQAHDLYAMPLSAFGTVLEEDEPAEAPEEPGAGREPRDLAAEARGKNGNGSEGKANEVDDWLSSPGKKKKKKAGRR